MFLMPQSLPEPVFSASESSSDLTLMRVMSVALPGAGEGGGWPPPPYLSWLWSKFWPQNHVSLKAGINYNSFGPFSEFFFQKSQKNWRKLKTYQKVAKNERKF